MAPVFDPSGLYLITDRKLAPGGDILKATEGALLGGVRLIQLREKDLSGAELLRLARSLRDKTRESGAALLINDRADIALLSGADGVHLGQKGFSPKDARKILGGRSIIGVSAHSLEEAKRAEDEGADFITFGPLYHTPSKAGFGEPVGPGMLKEVKKALRITVYAIGGIKKERVKEALEAGADGVAVISAVIGQDDPEKSAKELIEEIGRFRV